MIEQAKADELIPPGKCGSVVFSRFPGRVFQMEALIGTMLTADMRAQEGLAMAFTSSFPARLPGRNGASEVS